MVNHAARQTSYEALRASGRLGIIEEGVLLFELLSLSRNMSIPPDIYYWRDYQGHELDFIIKGDELQGIEVTTESRMRKKHYRNITYLSENIALDQIIIVGDFPYFEKVKVDSMGVMKLPFWLAF